MLNWISVPGDHLFWAHFWVHLLPNRPSVKQGITMKKIAIVVLSVVLGAAIISGLILYVEYLDTKDALLILSLIHI